MKVVFGLFILLAGVFAHASVGAVAIQRTVETPEVLSLDLAANVYRTEMVNDWYLDEVEVEVEEIYTDYEDFVTYERVCKPSAGIGRLPDCDMVRKVERRPVQKIHKVKKTRTESVCCRLQPKDVFDHIWNQRVQIRFPAEAVLVAGEVEELAVTLRGSEAMPLLDVESRGQFYRYRTSSVAREGDVFVFNLAVVPSLDPAKVGEESIREVSLEFGSDQASVRLIDGAPSETVETIFVARVVDRESGAVISERSLVARGGGDMVFPMGVALNPDGSYIVSVEVERKGAVVDGVVHFEVKKHFVNEKLDLRALSDSSRVGSIALKSLNASRVVISFRDNTKNYVTVDTVYKIEYLVNNVVFASRKVKRSDLEGASSGRFVFSLGDERAAAELANSVKLFGNLKVAIAVERTGDKISPVKFVRKANLKGNFRD